ncbi:MAG: rRNA ((1402)-N(4))-methyltransferase RsmH [Bacteroidota bacterium]
MPEKNSGVDTHQSESQSYHVPVLLNESVDALITDPSGVYVDCTFGGGGHSREILSRLSPTGRLFAFDQDADAKVNLTADTRLEFIPQNFRYISRFLRLHHIQSVDGILADLGVSSHQFDEPSRGFSIRSDAALDMRMDTRSPLTAASLIQQSSAEELQLIFQEFGEVTNSKTLAQLLFNQSRVAPIKTIESFKSIVAPLVKGNPHKYFAQVFQALRMVVNDEMGALQAMLEQSASLVKTGGRLVVITFHSIEDRMVKRFIKTGFTANTEEDPLYGIKQQAPFEPMHKKPIEASGEELKRNPRSRSARLRVGIKK